MELGRWYEENNLNKMKHFQSEQIALNSDTVLVIKIPDSQILRIMSRSLFLATVLVTLPLLGSIFRGFSSSTRSVVPGFKNASGSIDIKELNLLLHDLTDEGLLRQEDKILIMSPPHGFGCVIPVKNVGIDVVMDFDLERQSSLANESYEFVFTSNSGDAKFVDRILKIDGIAAFPLGTNPSNAFKGQSNYRVVYLRRYSSIIVALRKTGPSSKPKLYRSAVETKKLALKGLEDVFLEPPRQALVKSKKYLKKIKYLPDLLSDSLEGYKRRVFIGVGLPEENKGIIEWFQQNYPTRNKKFVIYSLQVGPEDQVMPHIDVSAWLSKHVKEEEYVVVKAEAEVVEEMMKKRTICLVDELFLECKNDWWQTKGKKKKGGRAYWECLALYGRLRDEGVAVHQWWG